MPLKITKKRQAILDTLEQHHGALSAAELHTRLPHIDLATIYRTLELFTAEKMIKKLHFSDSEAQYEYQHEPHHHAVCEQCEQVIHFTAPDEQIIKLLGLENFNVEELEVTVRGTHTHHSGPHS
ncbi:MAG TPA: transcriptional repressor [Candidatus Paceibacterota bacterium]|nr:transcriptional repressor [Candidatus Paceibacterota bacterium]